MQDEQKREAGIENIERQEEHHLEQELKLADRLALERTALAADRTILAGIRTAMAFIGFGFTIFNVLKYLQDHSPPKFMRPQTPRNFGLLMLIGGTVPLFFMVIQYSRTLKRMGKKERVLTNPIFQMAGIILLLGTILLVTLLGKFVLQL
jgi:putative membrane protein